jgi:hypothetical protein
MKKNITIGLILIAIALVGLFLFSRNSPSETYENENDNPNLIQSDEVVEDTESEEEMIDTTTEVSVIGQSADGKDIMAYRYGTGENKVLFVGGIHGGYSWNTSALAYNLISYFENDISVVPENVTATVIPVLNPDGLSEVTSVVGPFTASDVSATESQKVAGRFNGNEVDLNRNFDCDWNSVGTWQNKEVDGGTAPFSEPESLAVKNYIKDNNIDAVVVYYSSAGGVYASNCYNGILSETREMTNVYADASGYPAYEEFNFYEITGDMVNWLASEEIPAISVLLSDHQSTEWSKNREGIKAILEYYSEK